MQTQASTKETIVIVHGTFAAPEDGRTQWYQPVDGAASRDGFIAKLDAALGARGSPARCWAHCTDGAPIFHWSGDNDWVARTNAAAALRDYVAALAKQGWRCHIVAHSHGGNVVAEALGNSSAGPDEPPGRIVTLGTPFMDTMSPMLKSVEGRRKIADVVSWAGVIFMLLGLALINLAFLLNDSSSFIAVVDVLVLAGVAWLIRRRNQHTARSEARRGARATDPGMLPQLLAIGSVMDEPWQMLHYLRNANDPLRIQSNPLRYALAAVRSNISNRSDIARIRGAKSFDDFAGTTKTALWALQVFTFLTGLIGVGSWYTYRYLDTETGMFAGALTIMAVGLLVLCVFVLLSLVAFLTISLGIGFYSAYVSPFRWCVRRLLCLGSIFGALATYMVRRRAWPMLQAIAMGLEGYQYKLPDVRHEPTLTGVGAVKYEPLPKAAEDRALAMRSDWIGRHLGDVSQTFASFAVKSADLTSLLRAVEADQTLVHGAYYTDDACIARIADWIAGIG